MFEPATSQGFLDPALSVKVGQALSLAEKMGLSMQIPGISADLNIGTGLWQKGLGFGNPGGLFDAADTWNDIARKVLTSKGDLNTGANIALGRGATPTIPSDALLQQQAPATDDVLWRGETAKMFMAYVVSLNPVLDQLQKDAAAVAKGLTEAATSCFVFWAGIAAVFASALTGGAVDAAVAGGWGGVVALGGTLASAIVGKITDSLDKFQQAKTDIVSGRDVYPGIRDDGQFILVSGQYTAPTILPGF